MASISAASQHTRGGDRHAPVAIQPTPCAFLQSAGRCEKKGFDTLLKALALLPRGLHWRLTHIGFGGELGNLKSAAEALGISERVSWLGTLDQRDVLEQYRMSDLFVLPSRIADDGDRDGLPNVLMEAASQRLATISTTISGIPELVRNGVDGILLEPDDPDALGAAILRLGGDPGLRATLGNNAERRVRSEFDHQSGIAFLMELFNAQRAAA